MPTCQNCSVQFPNSVIVEGKKRNLQRRRFCLGCSPFGAHNTRPSLSPSHMRLCSLCDREFTGAKRRTRCMTCNTRIRRARAKLAAIAFMGGCCTRCGFQGHQSAFDFHHADGDKDFNIGDVANKSWKVLKKELAKCELLCANCHRIEHSKRENPRFVAEVERYQGTLLSW